jgi:4-coumarate--CoA ligase
MPTSILTSHYPTPPLPSTSTSLFHFYLPSHLDRPDDLAFVSAEHPTTSSYTRQSFRTNALRLGCGIKRRSTSNKAPQLALIFSPNSIHYPLIFFGLQSILTIASLANASYTSKELCHQLRDGKPQLLFVHPGLWDVANESLKILSTEPDERAWVEDVKVYFTVPTSELGPGRMDYRSTPIKSFDSIYVDERDLPRGWAGDELDDEEKDDRTAVLCYSSGTVSPTRSPSAPSLESPRTDLPTPPACARARRHSPKASPQRTATSLT